MAHLKLRTTDGTHHVIRRPHHQVYLPRRSLLGSRIRLQLRHRALGFSVKHVIKQSDEPAAVKPVVLEPPDEQAPSKQNVLEVQQGITPKRLLLSHSDAEILSGIDEDVLSIRDGFSACVHTLTCCTHIFSAHSACTVTSAHLHACAHTRMALVSAKKVLCTCVRILHLAFLLMSSPVTAVPVRSLRDHSLLICPKSAGHAPLRTCIATLGHLAKSDANTAWVVSDPPRFNAIWQVKEVRRTSSARRTKEDIFLLSQKNRFDNSVPNRFLEQTRISVLSWNPGPPRGKPGATEEHIAGSYRIPSSRVPHEPFLHYPFRLMCCPIQQRHFSLRHRG